MTDLQVFTEMTLAVNKAAYRVYGKRNSCIASSYALAYLLQLKGYDARPIRVIAGVFPKDRSCYASVLGSDGDGSFRPAAKKGNWHGHLAVIANQRYILDPTLDQANQRGIKVPPVVVELPDEVIQGKGHKFFVIGNCDVRYSIYRKQTGYINSPAARRIQWIEVAEKVIAQENRKFSRG